ncbi:OCSTP protein, partial [Pachycephala philippinensis]|nr:OCSTP protein [Pachycephala philippinensis]
MADLWWIYSKPVPADGRELCTLFLQCSCITAVIGGLFYNWMFASLEYSWHLSAATAISFSLLLLLTLLLVHPARCVFSMIMPTLGTKQGRKLLFSTCVMIAVVNITPNIISNIKTILQLIECICKTSSDSLLNSTALLEKVSWEFGDAVQETVHSIYKPMNGHFRFSLLQNSSLIYQKMHLAGEKISREFLSVEVLVKDSIRVANRLAAGFFMLYLCFESTWYLKNYLTNLRFDNFYITKKLEHLAVDRKAAHLLVGSSKKLIRPTGLKLSWEEVVLCLVQAMLVTVALMLMLVVVAMDHFAFSVADTAVRRAAQFSAVPVTLNIKYKVRAGVSWIMPFLFQVFGRPSEELVLGDFNRTYHHHLLFSSAQCRISPPTPPNPSVLLVVGLLFCILYTTVFLETYARRLCRGIAASFFQSWEEERVLYLYRKLARRHRKE